MLQEEILLEEILDPLGNDRRNIDVVNPYFLTRDPATKCLQVGPRSKQYGLVFDKRVVEPTTFQFYPHGYAEPDSEDDEEMAELLLDLM